MLDYSELKKGIIILFKNQPHEIIEASSMFKGRGHSTLQTKLKNLITSNIISENFHPSDNFEEIEIKKKEIKFIYAHKNKFVFSEKDNPSKRIEFEKNQLGSIAKFLKANQIVQGLVFKNKVINISLPIKISLKVVQAPPGIKGDRSQGGNKIVVLETGVEIAVPLFIKEGDIIEINTERQEYVKRLEKNN